MTCVRCGASSDLCVCPECFPLLTPLLQRLVSDADKGIETRVSLFFHYLDRINKLAKPA